MFERYFCKRVIARLHAMPYATHLEAFTTFLHNRGHARLTVQVYVRAAELFFRYLHQRRQPLDSVKEGLVRRFACRWRMTERPVANTHAALRHLLRYLRGVGLVPSRSIERPRSISRLIADYDAHLRDASGLAPATRLYRRRYATEFLGSVFGNGPIRWSRLRSTHVRGFVANFGRTGRPAAAQVSANALRSFLRWLRFCGHIASDLVAAVPRFPRWRLAALPPVLSDIQLVRLLNSFDRSTPVGCRDFAMAVCMIDLGLRVAEVPDLRLQDIDADARVVCLRAGKSRRDRILPMPKRVREALLCYLRWGRPVTTDEHVFVRHRAPLGMVVSRELVRAVIRRAYAVVPGCRQLTGTHILRHTTASRLLSAGADLKHIADILGHRSIDTTAVYAKIDMAQLAAVAAPWPTGSKEAQP